MDKTAQLIRNAIRDLLLGNASGVNDSTGVTQDSSGTNDLFKVNPKNMQSTYNGEFSVAKHMTSKEKVVEYKTEGMNQKADIVIDEVLKLPKLNITQNSQPERPLKTPTEDGAVENQKLDEENAKVMMPHNVVNDKAMMSLINSLSVAISNAVAESVTNIFMAKIEKNLTEIEIEWDDTQKMTISEVILNGAVIPGGSGFVTSANGMISFGKKSYKHKCKIKISGGV